MRCITKRKLVLSWAGSHTAGWCVRRVCGGRQEGAILGRSPEASWEGYPGKLATLEIFSFSHNSQKTLWCCPSHTYTGPGISNRMPLKRLLREFCSGIQVRDIAEHSLFSFPGSLGWHCGLLDRVLDWHAKTWAPSLIPNKQCVALPACIPALKR